MKHAARYIHDEMVEVRPGASHTADKNIGAQLGLRVLHYFDS